jgi:hypothetical protein
MNFQKQLKEITQEQLTISAQKYGTFKKSEKGLPSI